MIWAWIVGGLIAVALILELTESPAHRAAQGVWAALCYELSCRLAEILAVQVQTGLERVMWYGYVWLTGYCLLVIVPCLWYWRLVVKVADYEVRWTRYWTGTAQTIRG